MPKTAMETENKVHSSCVQAISLFLVGMGIGWLAGLSVSPVISGVLACLLGIAGGIVAGMRSVATGEPEEAPNRKIGKWIDARPAALLVMGVALGAPLGVLARTHHVLEPSEVRQPLPPSATASQIQAGQGVLFAVSASECAELVSMASNPNQAAFRAALKNSTIPWAKKLDEKVQDTETLRTLVRTLCAQD